MLCTRCRHDNPEENRYCGMCGERLESAQARKEEDPEPRSSESIEPAIGSIFGLNSALHPGDTRRPEPPISGPSFLGLNSGAESSGTSYLFDDEPASGHAGTWIALLLLLGLGLAGYHFRAPLRARGDQAYAAVMDRVNPRPAPPAPASAPSMAPSGASSSEAAPAASVPSEDLLKETQASNPAASPKLDLQPTPATATEQKSDESKEKDPPAAEKSPRRVSPNAAEEKAAVTPTRATGKSIGRHPTPSPEGVPSPDDMRLLQLAQKYIHGQGVRRDCQQGLNYLRGAMKHPNAPAASQMGALYATGTCVSQDRVAAYRWFSSALQMAPSNPWLARERDQIYAQMTSSERHQADRQ